MAAGIFVINDRDRACLMYCTVNARLNNLSEAVLIRLSDKILDALKYFGLYKFALHMGNDPVLTALLLY